MNKLVIGYLATLVFVIGVTSGYGAEQSQADGKGLFEAKCGTCHSIDRPKSKIKSKQEWEITVMRMKNVNRSPITDQEAKVIIEYLAWRFGKN